MLLNVECKGEFVLQIKLSLFVYSLFVCGCSRGSCLESDKLPHVMSLVSVISEDYKVKNENECGVKKKYTQILN